MSACIYYVVVLGSRKLIPSRRLVYYSTSRWDRTWMPYRFDFDFTWLWLDKLTSLETLLESDVVGMARGYRARCDSAPNHFFPLTFPHLFFILTCNLLFHHWMGRWSGWNVCLADLPMGVMPRMPRNRKEVLEIDKKSSENGNYQIKEDVKCFFPSKQRLWRDLSLNCFLWK